MNLVVLLRDPVRVLLSTLVGEVLTGTNLTNVEIRSLPAPLINLLNNSSLGDSSAGVGPEAVDVIEVPTLVFPSHVKISPINDNYGVDPTCIQALKFSWI